MKCLSFAACLVSALLCSAAHADSFSFTGNFVLDNDVQAFTFTLGAASTVTLRTFSYAGGTNAAGQTIERGGFDPIVALFSGVGPSATNINQNDDGSPFDVSQDPYTEEYFDAFLQTDLDAGDYTVTIQQYDNFFSGHLGDPISMGFQRDGAGHADFTAAYGCSQGNFCDVSFTDLYNNRTSDWAFDIAGVDAASIATVGVTPEPSSMLLVATGVIGTAGELRRRRII